MTENTHGLNDLMPGNYAIVRSHYFGDETWTIGTVARKTKTQIILKNGKRFRIDDGREIGRYWDHDYLFSVTPKRMDLVAQTRKREANRRLLSTILSTRRSVLEQLPDELLHSVADAIDSIEHRKDDDK